MRYIGIGNATGLGMAPYLINHPLLISRWIEVRETVLAMLQERPPTDQQVSHLKILLARARNHLEEIFTDNIEQDALNDRTREEIKDFEGWYSHSSNNSTNWRQITSYVAENHSVELQELINALLIEVSFEIGNEFEDLLSVEEVYELMPEMPLKELQQLIEQNYDWALAYDFSALGTQGIFLVSIRREDGTSTGH